MSSQNSEVPLGTGSTPKMGLAEVLQICCLGRRNGQITFRAYDNEGQIFVQHGQVLHSIHGTLEGEEAIYQMLTWTNGSYTFEDDVLPQRRTVQSTWEQLLFEGARRADEGISGPQIAADGSSAQGPMPIGSRLHGSQPKLTITIPDTKPFSHDLVNEFTHVGRVEGNEIVIPIPSVSSRHCIFIFSGTDIVLRDLNSANGTFVNGEAIAEKILQLGDNVQVGEAEIRFESGIKRPRLREAPVEPAPADDAKGKAAPGGIIRPKIDRSKAPETPSKPVDNERFLSGGAISIESLTQTREKKGPNMTLIIVISVIVILLVLIVAYGYAHAHGLIKF